MSTSIAQMSMYMNQANLQQNISTGVMKKAMDTSTQLAQNLIEMMPDSPTAFSGDVGAIFDARA